MDKYTEKGDGLDSNEEEILYYPESFYPNKEKIE